MADGHGGARTPANPAPVSGPGALSKRTDGVQAPQYLAGGAYGDGGLMDVQGGAPMAAEPVRPPLVAPVPLAADTAEPGVPVTDGAALGPGAGVLPAMPGDPELDWAAGQAKYLPGLIAVANGPQGSPNLRRYVRELRLAVASRQANA